MESHAPEQSDTIVALATPRGRGALGIVRLSGEQAIEIAAGLSPRPDDLRQQDSHRIRLRGVHDVDGALLDRALVAVFRAPRSYTGEDMVELYLHGSPYVMARTIEHSRQRGARIAQPGEFTQRAFLNGRLDLAQAEAVADLIAADSQAAHRAAISQREGFLSQKIRTIREALVELYSLVELQIDFADQDLPVVEEERIKIVLDGAIRELEVLGASYERGRLMREGAVVAIAGAPNVGKSTLFNTLIGEEKAIVDASPGTTRDAVEALVEWEGWAIRLLDTAGQADGMMGPDEQAVDKAKIVTRSADVVLWVVDLSAEDGAAQAIANDNRTIIIGNKADLCAGPLDRRIELSVCALRGDGLDRLKAAVMDRLLPRGGPEWSEGLLTRERHLEAVKRGLQALESAREVLRQKRGEELLAMDLREAGKALGEIIGEVTPDDVLNRIFADFCIGK
jgi:tRNA modification GTPase